MTFLWITIKLQFPHHQVAIAFERESISIPRLLDGLEKEERKHDGQKILTKKRWYISAGYILCGLNLESVNGLFFRCPFSRSLWTIIKLQLHLRGRSSTFHDLSVDHHRVAIAFKWETISIPGPWMVGEGRTHENMMARHAGTSFLQWCVERIGGKEISIFF